VAEQESRRVFFALWPDAVANDALDSAARLATAICGGRRMRRDTLHLTLVFIGTASSTQLAALREAAGRVRAAPCEFVLDRLGCWKHNRIAWAGCQETPPGLLGLQADLAHNLVLAGFPAEDRAYMPHVTLVRNANCGVLPSMEQPIAWQALEFTLVESHLSNQGARYRVLDRWSLKG
jgi:2'-5' RNA ligase